jgi:hypothetical protein
MGLMPLTYHINPEAGMLFVVGEGVITQTERLAAMRAWMSDKAFRPGLNTLCDFSGATTVPTLDELMQIATFIEENSRRIGHKKLALVTPVPLASAVARQFKMLSVPGPLRVRVFTNRYDARAWLLERESPARILSSRYDEK